MNQISPETKSAGIAASAQCARTLVALRKRPHTTLELRRLHDVLHPAARVMELRERGESIQTMWITDHTSEGKPHRVARYVLVPGAPR